MVITWNIKFNLSVVTKALTDDFTLGVPPPDNDENHQAVWEQCSSMLKFIADESKAIANLEICVGFAFNANFQIIY